MAMLRMTNLSSVLLFLLLLGFSFTSLGQMIEEDQEKFDTSMSWLIQNLEYSYQNQSTGVWWSNNFFYDAGNKEITLKNASSDKPNEMSKSVRFDRIVKLAELDLESARIEEVKEDAGRIVKGKVLHIDAIGKQQRIQKLYNGKESFKEFFVKVSFPSTNEDFLAKADECMAHFKNVIELSTKVYPAPDSLHNTNYIFELIPGLYEGNNQTICEVAELFPHSLELKFMREEKIYKKSVISYDETNHHFIYWMVNQAGSSHFELNLNYQQQIVLSANSENYSLTFPNTNQFLILDEGENIAYRRIDF